MCGDSCRSQRPDCRLQSRSWYAEFGGCAGGSVHPSPAFAECGLNDCFLLRRKPLKEAKPPVRLSWNGLPRKPTLIDGEILRFTYDDRALDHVLRFANITRPGIRLNQIEALFADRLKALS